MSPHSRSWRSRCVCLRKNSKCRKHKSSVTHCVGEATIFFNQDFLGRENKRGQWCWVGWGHACKVHRGKSCGRSLGSGKIPVCFHLGLWRTLVIFPGCYPGGQNNEPSPPTPPRCPHLNSRNLVECITLHDRGTLLRIWLNQVFGEQESNLNCTGGPSVITPVLIGARRRQERHPFEDRGGTMSPGMQVACGSWKRQENKFFPTASGKELSLTDTECSLVRTISGSWPLKLWITNASCFKPLPLWSFLTEGIGN